MDQAEISKVLRQEFEEKYVGKLPRITCLYCSSRGKKGDPCSHQKAKCNTCGAYISTQHIHLDYIGHADVTDRLLTADPEWNWEPCEIELAPNIEAIISSLGDCELTRDLLAKAPPKFEKDAAGNKIGLWIQMTVGGVTRKGYGSVESGVFDPEKQLIGDAIRNAGMRFGIALQLWSKAEKLESTASVENSGAEKLAPNRMQEPYGLCGVCNEPIFLETDGRTRAGVCAKGHRKEITGSKKQPSATHEQAADHLRDLFLSDVESERKILFDAGYVSACGLKPSEWLQQQEEGVAVFINEAVKEYKKSGQLVAKQ